MKELVFPEIMNKYWRVKCLYNDDLDEEKMMIMKIMIGGVFDFGCLADNYHSDIFSTLGGDYFSMLPQQFTITQNTKTNT